MSIGALLDFTDDDLWQALAGAQRMNKQEKSAANQPTAEGVVALDFTQHLALTQLTLEDTGGEQVSLLTDPIQFIPDATEMELMVIDEKAAFNVADDATGEFAKRRTCMPKNQLVDELWDEYIGTQKPQARDKLLLKYLPLAKYVAGKMMATLPSSVDYDDLVSAGVIGLIGALERFDPSMGVKFETFVLPRIRGAILDELRKLDWAPRSLRAKARKLERTIAELERELGRAVSDQEVAQRLRMNTDDFVSLLREVNSAALVSLDGNDKDESEHASSMYDVVENPLAENPFGKIEKKEVKKLLIETIEKLPEQEKIVMALYYYEELTLREIGQVLRITESRVSQIHSKAIESMREILAKELLS